MCKVIIEKPNEKKGFIIVNHLYARKNSSFTIDELIPELETYGLTLTREELQEEINQLIEDGAVSMRVGYYKTMAML